MKYYGKTVIVKDGNVEKALRKFKKKVQDSGLLQKVCGPQSLAQAIGRTNFTKKVVLIRIL